MHTKFWRKTSRKVSLGTLKCRYDDNIKIDLKQHERGVFRINLDEVRGQFRALLNNETQFRVPQIPK
jgi:hypothetical protein